METTQSTLRRERKSTAEKDRKQKVHLLFKIKKIEPKNRLTSQSIKSLQQPDQPLAPHQSHKVSKLPQKLEKLDPFILMHFTYHKDKGET